MCSSISLYIYIYIYIYVYICERDIHVCVCLSLHVLCEVISDGVMMYRKLTNIIYLTRDVMLLSKMSLLNVKKNHCKNKVYCTRIELF